MPRASDSDDDIAVPNAADQLNDESKDPSSQPPLLEGNRNDDGEFAELQRPADR